jgi:hypothetical protein
MGGVRYTRRRFLGTVGAGALAGGGALSLGGGAEARHERVGGGFGRMFPSLPPFAQPSQRLTEALVEIGRPGGMLDAKDDLSLGAADLFLEKYLFTDFTNYRFVPDKENPSNSYSVAGTTFFAQFVAHDISFDATSALGHGTDPARALNARTPRLDLESVYGGGAALAPHLYDPSNPAKLRVESGGRFEDVPRAASGTALVGDIRNDQTAIVSALHAAFLLFHNRAVDHVGSFEAARRETRWHYQWLVAHDFLPHVVGEDVAQDVLRNGRRFYRPSGTAAVPVEFASAAYRFGHSMIRPSYRLNFSGDAGKPLFAFTFDPRENGKDEPRDLRGGFRAPDRFVDWESFFDFGDEKVGRPKRIDTRISTPLFNLPTAAIPTFDPPHSLPTRDLLRHVTFGIPSGQAIAREIGAEPLSRIDLQDLEPFGLETSSPLWLYVLKEAELVEDGARLGPVGARIVAEVLVGLLESDPQSFLRARPGWQPTFGRDGLFEMTDFLRFAGVDPASRGPAA